MTWWRSLNSHRQIPNLLCLLRAILGMSLPFLVISHHPGSHIAALVIFTIASVTDYSDGWFARRFNVVSDFGKIADPTADKILILA
ncbi:MAG: CDP-alcohol phosphatidyltransferase family protein, partial [Candidatus Omnitrophota bacterium]